MTARRDYMPLKVEDFNSFQSNLVSILDLHVPGTALPWGFTFAELDGLKLLQSAFVAAFAVADPIAKKGSRNSAQVEAMQEALDAYKKAIREFVAEFLAKSKKVTDADRVLMNITVYDTEPSPAPVQSTVPFVEIQLGSGAQLIITFRQESHKTGGSRRAKPVGVSRMEMRYKIGGTVPANHNTCPESDSASRSPFTLTFDESDSGKRVYFFFRWVNTRNQGGPWTADAISSIIP